MTVSRSKQSELLTLLRNPATGNSLVLEDGAMVDPVTDERFEIRDGIPVILQEETVVGLNRKYQKRYDWFSYLYDAMYRGNIMLNEYLPIDYVDLRRLFAELAETMVVEDDDRVLETSIGTGQQVRNLSEHGVNAHFFGNDLSYGMLNKCRRNMKKWGIDVGLVQGNAEALPFDDELFDVVFHIGGINFFNDKGAAVEEMVRVAKPGANVYIGDETESAAREAPKFISWFLQEPEPGMYDPPTRFIPDEMRDVTTQKLFDDDLYMISFRKPTE